MNLNSRSRIQNPQLNITCNYDYVPYSVRLSKIFLLFYSVIVGLTTVYKLYSFLHYWHIVTWSQYSYLFMSLTEQFHQCRKNVFILLIIEHTNRYHPWQHACTLNKKILSLHFIKHTRFVWENVPGMSQCWISKRNNFTKCLTILTILLTTSPKYLNYAQIAGLLWEKREFCWVIAALNS